MVHINTKGLEMRRLVTLLVLSFAVTLPIPSIAALRVFACEPEWAELVKELAGERVRVDTATQAGQDPHYVQPRPGLISKIRRADFLVCTGAGLEAGWLPILMRKGNNKKILAGNPGHLMISNVVQLKEKPEILDRSKGDVHAAGNPHLQLDPRNMLPAAKEIVNRLAILDPENAGSYRRSLDVFIEQWQEAIASWQLKAMPLKGVPILVYHRSWVYLQDWLGLKEIAAIEPKPGIPPGSRYLAELVSRVQGVQNLVLIHSQYQQSKSIQWFSSKSGAPIVLLPSTVGGTREATNLFSWYEDIITRLLDSGKAGE